MKHHNSIFVAKTDAVYGGHRPAAVRGYHFYAIRDIQQQAGESMARFGMQAEAEIEKELQFEPVGIEVAVPMLDHLTKAPTQFLPQIDREETEANQQEAQGWITRGRPGSHLAHAAIAAFDAEAAAIQAMHFP